MYQTILNFKIKKSLVANRRILEMFFEDWVDDTTTQYSIVVDRWQAPKMLSVQFEHSEDAVAIKLKGIPPQFQDYIELQ